MLQNEERVPQPRWDERVLRVLKVRSVRLAAYVPDNVLKPLISRLERDPFFRVVNTAREEEAVGIVAGAWMAGLHGIVLMQTSGFATLANVLASLAVPYELPVLMMVSERGTLGEFNIGQTLTLRTMRPILDSLGIETIWMTRSDEVEFQLDRSIVQAVATRRPVAFILSPLLTGGKTFEA